LTPILIVIKNSQVAASGYDPISKLANAPQRIASQPSQPRLGGFDMSSLFWRVLLIGAFLSLASGAYGQVAQNASAAQTNANVPNAPSGSGQNQGASSGQAATPAPPNQGSSPGQTLVQTDANGAIPLDTITVTATMTDESVIDAMGGVSTVTQNQLNTIQPQRFSEVLQDVPGVTTQDSQNDPMQSINIRGMQDFGRVNVLVDGARQDYQISGHNANGTFYLDPDFICGIDIVRGPISNIYGSGAIGGVASFRTCGTNDILLPDENYGALEHFGFGSNGAGLVESIAGAARMGSTADVYGQFVFRNPTSYHDGSGALVEDTGSQLEGGLTKLSFRPLQGQEIIGTAMVQNYLFDNLSTANAGPLWKNDAQTTQFTLGYTVQRPDIPWLDFSLKGYSQSTRNDQAVLSFAEDPTDSAAYQALGVVPGDGLYDEIHTYGFDAHDTARFSTAIFDHAVTFGGDGAWDFVSTQDDAGGYISALTPGGQRSLTGAFVQDDIHYSTWLRVLGAVRYDNYSLSGGGFGSNGSHLSPKITVGVTPIKGFEIYGTYATGYRAPSVTETLIDGTHPFPAFNVLPNPDLAPEVATDVEGGVNLKYDNIIRPGDSLRLKADTYLNKVQNYIDFTTVGAPYLVPFIPGAPVSTCAMEPFLCFPINSFQYVNIGEAQISGVELEGTYDWGGGYITVSGTHIDGKDVTSSIPLYTIPPDRISGTLGLRFLNEKLVVGTRLTFVDASQYFPTSEDSGPTFAPTAGYALIDLFGSYKYNDDISANLTVKNLLNKYYIQYLDTLPNPGLTVMGSLTVRFASK
jgi:hemoglobin/transferrin/lactoferrin receptor protein